MDKAIGMAKILYSIGTTRCTAYRWTCFLRTSVSWNAFEPFDFMAFHTTA